MKYSFYKFIYSLYKVCCLLKNDLLLGIPHAIHLEEYSVDDMDMLSTVLGKKNKWFCFANMKMSLSVGLRKRLRDGFMEIFCSGTAFAMWR